MYMYIWEILSNLCNRNYENPPQNSAQGSNFGLSQNSVEVHAPACAVVIYLFTYLFNRFIPMNPAP